MLLLRCVRTRIEMHELKLLNQFVLPFATLSYRRLPSSSTRTSSSSRRTPLSLSSSRFLTRGSDTSSNSESPSSSTSSRLSRPVLRPSWPSLLSGSSFWRRLWLTLRVSRKLPRLTYAMSVLRTDRYIVRFIQVWPRPRPSKRLVAAAIRNEVVEMQG